MTAHECRLASRNAVAAPIPDEDPVITATLRSDVEVLVIMCTRLPGYCQNCVSATHSNQTTAPSWKRASARMFAVYLPIAPKFRSCQGCDSREAFRKERKTSHLDLREIFRRRHSVQMSL